jgi:hypothetical protein
MASRTIPEHLIDPILDKAAAREGTRAIAAWLGSEHGIEVSHASVARLLGKFRKERAEVTRDVVRSRLEPVVVSDLDRLGELRQEAADILKAAKEDDNGKLALQAIAEERAIIRDRLHFAGADPADSDASSISDVLAALAADPEG